MPTLAIDRHFGDKQISSPRQPRDGCECPVLGSEAFLVAIAAV